MNILDSNVITDERMPKDEIGVIFLDREGNLKTMKITNLAQYEIPIPEESAGETDATPVY